MGAVLVGFLVDKHNTIAKVPTKRFKSKKNFLVKMNISHELFGLWVVHSGLVLVKTMGMSLWTAKRRVATQTFANPEDTKGPVANNESKVDLANPEVGRVRRCHLNDIENVFPFVFLGFLYISTNPTLAGAKLAFRIFTAARFLHSIVYVFAVPQPSRALAFFANMGVTMYMSYSVISKYWAHM